jgi:RNA polymerase sigma-70 factor (ECF subfamily)
MTLTIAEVERLRMLAAESGEHVALEMDEDAFRAFYDRTARTLWAYLARLTGDPSEADDLLQESYYRFLRARGSHESDQHRRNALFAIATNLARDRHRRRRVDPIASAAGRDSADIADPARSCANRIDRQADLSRALGRLKPRDRGLLWLAYAQGWSHREIAGAMGLKTTSVKPLLFRARHRLAALLRGHGTGDRS